MKMDPLQKLDALLDDVQSGLVVKQEMLRLFGFGEKDVDRGVVVWNENNEVVKL